MVDKQVGEVRASVECGEHEWGVAEGGLGVEVDKAAAAAVGEENVFGDVEVGVVATTIM